MALFSAAAGPAYAGVHSTSSPQTNIYDLVHDGVTSADGGDHTVSLQAPAVTAAAALEASIGGWASLGFTGRTDPALAAGGAYPSVPLGAAGGTSPDQEFVLTAGDDVQRSPVWKARAIAEARLSPLIGKVGGAAVQDDRSGSTVFVSAGSSGEFAVAGFGDSQRRSSSVGYAFAPSSSSTATITVASGGLGRQGPGRNPFVIAANSLQLTPPAPGDTSSGNNVAMSDTAQPTLGYNYAPPATVAAANPATVAASFSDAISASGTQIADRVAAYRVQMSQLQTGGGSLQISQLQPALVQTGAGRLQTSQARTGQNGAGTMQTSQVQPGQSAVGQPDRFQTSEAAANMGALLNLISATPAAHGDLQADGTRSFISASVSANPSASAVRFMASVIAATPTSPVAGSIEAFQVGPAPATTVPGTTIQATAATTVRQPLGGKILASAGPLNSALALP